MPLVLLHRRYERRCNACGCAWQVPRGEARLHPPSINRFQALSSTGRGISESENEIGIESMISEQDALREAYESTRRCPACGVDDFRQRPFKEK
jgi:hypothetical protein